MTTSYHVEYDGYYGMFWHDNEANSLKRWFDNYKIERFVNFASETECLIVKEIKFKNRIRYVCEIEDVGRNTKREVLIDHTAPKPPLLTFAARRRYEPPPPKSAEELRKEYEFNRMMMAGYEPVYVKKPKPYILPVVCFSPNDLPDLCTTMEYDVEIEWVKMRHDRFSKIDVPLSKPVIPKHRRN